MGVSPPEISGCDADSFRLGVKDSRYEYEQQLQVPKMIHARHSNVFGYIML
jgi:hypothetical protein